MTGLTLTDIEKAHERIAHKIVQTPIVHSEQLDRLLGVRLVFKAEVLQTTGAFKYRGATHFLSRLTAEQRERGIVAFSSGNHAQAVAAAAADIGITAKIVMPADAPAIKIAGTRAWGAEIILYNRQTESREAIAAAIAEADSRTVVPPFDHPWTMAGQGTAGLEFARQLADRGMVLDSLLIPCSGGGLTAGVSTAFKSLSPSTRIYGVEPEGYDDTRQSLAAGEVTAIAPQQATLCDSLALTQPGYQTLPVLQANLAGVLVVDDKVTTRAVQLVFQHLKLVAEPGGAIGLGAVLKDPGRFADQTVGIILSGGNVDPALFAQLLTTSA